MSNPWQHFELSPMGLCEEPIIGVWIRTPANTWSNIAFILVGLFIFLKYRNQFKETPLLKIIPISAIIIGLCSFIYHASYTLELLFLDNTSMFLLSAFIVSINFMRLLDVQKKIFWLLYLFSFSFPTVLMFVFKGASGSILFLIFYLFALSLEIFIKRQKNDIKTYKYFFLMIGCQLVAACFWLLDQQGVICNPQNHFFQGHIFWHVFNAISIFFLYKHYELYFKRKSV